MEILRVVLIFALMSGVSFGVMWWAFKRAAKDLDAPKRK